MKRAPKLKPGSRIGRLVLKRSERVRLGEKGHVYTRWYCDCDCGTKDYSILSNNFHGRVPTRSCGCYQRECISKRSRTHGEHGYKGKRSTPEYIAWCHMLKRCRTRKLPEFPRYGGRGISVCLRWHDYQNFLADMGRRPGPELTLERLDNDGNYEPGNVCWADRKDQARNTRRNVWLTIRGERKILKDWAEEAGIKQATISRRLKLGWSDEEAVLTPVRSWRNRNVSVPHRR